MGCWFCARLKEGSTWGGIGVACSGAAATLPEYAHALFSIALVCAVLAVVFKDAGASS